MGKKRKKTGVRRANGPALSKTDTALYVLLILLIGFALPYGMMFGINAVSKHLAASNPHMTAWTATGPTALFVAVALLPIAGVFFFICLLSFRQPLFGRTDVTYGYPFAASIYPLFLKDRQSRPPTKAALLAHRRLGKAFAGLLVLYLIIGAAGAANICPRCEVQDDLMLVCYNVVNEPYRYYTVNDLKDVSMWTETTRYGWAVRVRLTASDGRAIVFSTPGTCAKLLELIRALPPEIVSVSGAERLPDVFDRYALTESETNALRELFALS